MSIGFVLINTAPSQEYLVYNKLSKIPEIIELHPLFGEFDLIVKVNAGDFEKIGHFIVDRIKTIEGVIDTKVLTGT